MEKIKANITRIVKHLEVNNDKCHNYYFLIYFRTEQIKDDGRKYYSKNPIKIIVWFDVFDLMDYYGDQPITDRMIREYAAEIALNTIDDTYSDLRELISDCNKTIENFNGTARNLQAVA